MYPMSKELTKQKFKEAKEHLIRHNARTKKIIPVNKYLKKYNWAFVHPYLIGAEVDHFSELAQNNSGDKDSIYRVFANSFFDLQTTALFIDGYFKKRPSLYPFCQLIDQSVFLCLQRDYAGAINSLIPVIEGSIRHYLINVVGKTNESIMKSEELLKVFYYLKKDFLKRQKDYYENEYAKFFGMQVPFDKSQVKQLLKYETENIDIWFAIILEYFKQNLYLDTRTGVVNDKLNRHSIFHGFNGDIYYNLENYLKIYNCINFLSWAFGIADPNVNALTTLEREDILYKWKAFEKVRIISKLSTEIKSTVYEQYSDFNKNEFERDLIQTKVDKAVCKISTVELKLKFIDRVLL